MKRSRRKILIRIQSKIEIVECTKTLKNTRFFKDFCLAGDSLAGSVAASGGLVAIRTPLGRVLETM